MGNAKHVSTDANARRHEHSAASTLSLITTMADTTWRMFVPTIGLLLIGNSIDDTYHTGPWMMLLCACAGGCVAALLVRRQMLRGHGV